MNRMTSSATAYERVIDAARAIGKTVLEHGDRASIQCPAHDDRSPSLSVGPRRDGDGAVIHCHAGCETGDVLDALGLAPRDLFNETKTRPCAAPTFTPRRPSTSRDIPASAADSRDYLRTLVARFGTLAAAGQARAETHHNPHCAHCSAADPLGGPQWWGRFCADCAAGWAPPDSIAEQQRWNAEKQAAVAISQTSDWNQVAKRVRKAQ